MTEPIAHRILLVEDQFLIALDIEDTLEAAGCKVDDLAGHRVHEIIGVRGALHRVFCH